MVRRSVLVTVVAVGLLALGFALGARGAFGASPVYADPPRREPGTITVMGDADVRVPPDEVVLTLGVETEHRELAVAVAQNDEAVESLLALAQEYGVPARHVQTEFMSVSPIHDTDYAKRYRVVGYMAQKTVVITLNDMTRFEDLLGDALLAGANYVHGVQFRTTQLREHRDAARALAIQAAREKAEALAAELDLRVGDPQTITEQYSGWWSPYSSWWGGGYGGGMSQNVVQQVGSSEYASDSAISPGQISVNARVSATFEIVH